MSLTAFQTTPNVPDQRPDDMKRHKMNAGTLSLMSRRNRLLASFVVVIGRSHMIKPGQDEGAYQSYCKGVLHWPGRRVASVLAMTTATAEYAVAVRSARE